MARTMQEPQDLNEEEMMDGDEVEMTKDELQMWIRERIEKMGMLPPDVLEKCNRLQLLLEKREKQAATLLRLCESVTRCEVIVKKQCSLLGLEYRDTDSDDDDDDDDDDNIKCCGNVPSRCGSVPSEVNVLSSPAAPGHTLGSQPEDVSKSFGENNKKSSFILKRELKVFLSRLPESQLAAFQPAASQNQPQQHEPEPLSDSGSDLDWEPQEDLSDPDYSSTTFKARKKRKIESKSEDNSFDSDFSASSFKTKPKRKRKVAKNNEKPAKSNGTDASTPNRSATTVAKRKATEKSTAKPSSTTATKGNATEKSTPKAGATTVTKSIAEKTPSPQVSTNTCDKNKTASPKTVAVNNDHATKIPPDLPPEKLVVGMTVLARKTVMSWQRGKILEIVKKEDGGLKYKVQFEEKGKILVSGHHVAFSTTPKVNQLYIGARVVVRSEKDTAQFRPGILSELPSRKNRSRFLIFDDGHVPVYVGLPLFHLVCRPLKEPLEDIPDGHHKIFMKQYIKDWPYPHLSQYRLEQSLNADYKGVQQKCEVVSLDCSLMEVVFEEDQHKTWLHRGSIRLQHVAKFLVKDAVVTEGDSE